MSTEMMTDAIQSIPPRDRFAAVSSRWKTLTAEEKKEYDDNINYHKYIGVQDQENREEVKPKENMDKDVDLEMAFDELFA